MAGMCSVTELWRQKSGLEHFMSPTLVSNPGISYFCFPGTGDSKCALPPSLAYLLIFYSTFLGVCLFAQSFHRFGTFFPLVLKCGCLGCKSSQWNWLLCQQEQHSRGGLSPQAPSMATRKPLLGVCSDQQWCRHPNKMACVLCTGNESKVFLKF